MLTDRDVPGCGRRARAAWSVCAKEEFPPQGFRETTSSSNGYGAATAWLILHQFILKKDLF